VRPDLIMMSSCLFGQTGPLKRYAGFGTMGASLAGFFHLTGWPDRPPCGPFGAYSDYPSPRFALCAVLAALDHRRRTGEGQYIDFSQAEACVHFLSPAILDMAVNGRCQTRAGNSDPHMAPHGVYPSAGDDRWVAIACRDDTEWRALAAIVGRDDLAGLTTAERLARRDELDTIVAGWTADKPPEAAAEIVIAVGVPAHAVQNSGECMEDPQLAHLGHFVTLPHPDHGTIVVEASRCVLSDTPAEVAGTPPFLGQDTVDVLLGELGYDDGRLGELYAASALD
jgi:benzylsuccinate CoA-transferase BbsF subunit